MQLMMFINLRGIYQDGLLHFCEFLIVILRRPLFIELESTLEAP